MATAEQTGTTTQVGTNEAKRPYVTFDRADGNMTVGGFNINPIKVHKRDAKATLLLQKAGKAKDGDEPNAVRVRRRMAALAMLDVAIGYLARTDKDSGALDPAIDSKLDNEW